MTVMRWSLIAYAKRIQWQSTLNSRHQSAHCNTHEKLLENIPICPVRLHYPGFTNGCHKSVSLNSMCSTRWQKSLNSTVFRTSRRRSEERRVGKERVAERGG